MPSVGGRLRGPGTPEPPSNPALTIAVGRFHRLAKLVVFFAVSSFRYLVARAVLVIHRELRRSSCSSSSSSSSASFSFVLSGGVTVRLTLAAFCNWPRFHLDPRSPQSINRKSHLTVKCNHRRKCSNRLWHFDTWCGDHAMRLLPTVRSCFCLWFHALHRILTGPA